MTTVQRFEQFCERTLGNNFLNFPTENYFGFFLRISQIDLYLVEVSRSITRASRVGLRGSFGQTVFPMSLSKFEINMNHCPIFQHLRYCLYLWFFPDQCHRRLTVLTWPCYIRSVAIIHYSRNKDILKIFCCL